MVSILDKEQNVDVLPLTVYNCFIILICQCWFFSFVWKRKLCFISKLFCLLLIFFCKWQQIYFEIHKWHILFSNLFLCLFVYLYHFVSVEFDHLWKAIIYIYINKHWVILHFIFSFLIVRLFLFTHLFIQLCIH